MVLKNSIFFLYLVLSQIVFVFCNECCPSGQYVLQRSNTCWEPTTNVSTPVIAVSCKTYIRRNSDFKVNERGSLVWQIAEGREATFDPSIFCVGQQTNIKDVNLTKIKPVFIMCASKPIIDYEVFGYCMILSVIFLVAIVVIYAALPELRDLYGKTIISFCCTLSLAFIVRAVIFINIPTNKDLCAIQGILAYFFVLATFFWSNVICIQVFRSIRSPTIPDYGWKEYMWYASYAWVCPAILTIIVSIVNFHPDIHDKPGLGRLASRCWFSSSRHIWYYLLSLLSILFIVNICIFVYCLFIVWRNTFASTMTKALKYKFVLSVKLIFIMGLPWIFEAINLLVKPHVVWSIIDVLNALQGVLMFLVLVVFRKRVLKVMHQHGWLDCVGGRVEKFLATADEEEDVIQHTEVPMVDNLVKRC